MRADRTVEPQVRSHVWPFCCHHLFIDENAEPGRVPSPNQSYSRSDGSARPGNPRVLSLSAGRARRGMGMSTTSDASGIIALVTRPAVRVRLAAVSAELGLPKPWFITHLGEALESGVDRGSLFVDLADCSTEPDLLRVFPAWDAFRPGTEIILFAPLLDRAPELQAIASISQSVRSCEVRVITGADLYDDAVWHNLAELRVHAELEAEFRTEFLNAIRHTGRALRAEPAFLILLHDTRRSATNSNKIGSPNAAASNAETERKALWKFLTRSGQMPASWLVLVFRVLWYTKLRERRWSPSRIANFLGFSSSRQFRLTIKRRLGIGLEQLKAVPHSDALDWAVTLVTRSHVRTVSTQVRDLVAPLLSPRRESGR